MKQTTRFLFVTVAVAAMLALTSCAARPASPVPTDAQGATVTFKGADFSFEGPEQISAGLTMVNFQNVGKEVHHIQFARLNDGVTLGQLQDALKKGDAEALPLVTLSGGVSALDPQGNGSVTLNLPGGQYVLLCFIRRRTAWRMWPRAWSNRWWFRERRTTCRNRRPT